MERKRFWPTTKNKNRTWLTGLWFQLRGQVFPERIRSLLRPLPLGVFPMDCFRFEQAVDGLGQTLS